MRPNALLTLALLLVASQYALAATYHIDPTSEAAGEPDGSLERPFTAWDQVKLQAGNTYLQKRGTVTRPAELRPSSDVILGAYGEGPLPKIESIAEGDAGAMAAWRAKDITIRDLEITCAKGVSLIKFNGTENVTIEGCRMHDSHWGIRLYGGGGKHRILNTEVYNILDDGMFIQSIREVEIAGCYVHDVNTNWKPPYTSQKDAGGDAIQFSQCDDWHVHHNRLDRTNSGNKFCFISNDAQTRGLFEHNELIGPLTQGDGGSSIYLGTGGSGVIVRYNRITAPSCGAIYHHTGGLQVYGNVINGLPIGFTNYGVDPPTQIHHNVFIGVDEPLKGRDYEARDNLDVTPADGPGASTLQLRLGKVGLRAAGRAVTSIPENHTGALVAEATTLKSLSIDGKPVSLSATEVVLQGFIRMEEEKMTRGLFRITADGESVCDFGVGAGGFGLERLLAGRVAWCKLNKTSLAGADITHWASGKLLGAWVLMDVDANEVQVTITSGTP